MALSESQLETWSNQGAVTSSAQAYNSVKAALGASRALTGRDFEVYLQGSYRNSTNIRGDSDVDVVVELRETFTWEVSEWLDVGTRTRQHAAVQALPRATYPFEQFRTDVLDALVSYYSDTRVKNGNKCLTVRDAGGTGIAADVVPCVTHRRYTGFGILDAPLWLEGMSFFTRHERRQVINYPKLHYANEVTKQGNTFDRFKSSVRVFKNVRRRLVDSGRLQAATAPSYFIECLLFNVPDQHFAQFSWQDRVEALFNYVVNADTSGFTCSNGVTRLFGTTPEQWNVNDLLSYLAEFRRLWNEG